MYPVLAWTRPWLRATLRRAAPAEMREPSFERHATWDDSAGPLIGAQDGTIAMATSDILHSIALTVESPPA